MDEQMIITDEMIDDGYRAFVARKPIASTDAEREACKAIYAAMAAHSVMAGKVVELEGVAQQAADALYPFISMIAHAFDEDGRHYWMREPTEAEAQAALKATNAVSAALAPYPERRSE